MRQGHKAIILIVILGVFPFPAQAQNIPIWMVAAVLSPIPVLFLCIILGVLANSVRIGAIHTAVIFTWVLLFTLACFFVENDYVIWTPLVLYILHSILLVVLIAVVAARRISGRTGTG